MAWTAPSTWVAGAVLTAAQLNQQLRDNMNFLAIPNMCRARSTTATTIPNATATIIPFAAADSYDTAAMHSTTVNNSRVTVGLVGVYSITGLIYLTANGTGQRIIVVYKNGAELESIQIPAVSGAFTCRIGITTLNYASAITDYYEIGLFQDSTTSLLLSGVGPGGETAALAVTYMGATA